MKKQYIVVLCLLAAISVFGCSRMGTRVLHVYNWEEYIDPDLVADFEKQFKCKVEIDIFDSSEELNETIRAGEKKYDIIFPANSTAREMYENRLIRDIDHSKIPNLKNLDHSFVKRSTDSMMKYSIPYMISFTGIAYNKNKVKDFKPTWAMFNRPDLAGRIALLDDERETIGSASKMLGYSYNGSDDIQLGKATNLVLSWKKNGAAFGDNFDLEKGLISGEYDLIQDYSGDAMLLMAEHPEIGFVLPEEGTALSLDSFAVPITSTNTELVYEFINFFLDAENAKKNMLYVLYSTPNVEAMKLLPKEFLENQAITPPESLLLKSEYLAYLGEDEKKYRTLWRTILPKE